MQAEPASESEPEPEPEPAPEPEFESEPEPAPETLAELLDSFDCRTEHGALIALSLSSDSVMVENGASLYVQGREPF